MLLFIVDLHMTAKKFLDYGSFISVMQKKLDLI